jgi:hypothetical protein
MGGLAHAQKYEFGVTAGLSHLNKPAWGSISGSDTAQDYDTDIKAQQSIGAWVGLNTRGYYGHEFNYQITYAKVNSILRTTTDDVTTQATYRDRIAIHRVGYNFLIYFMPNGSRWRPFVTGGANAAQYQSPNIAGWSYGSNRAYGANYGAGLKLIPMPHALLRLDVRDYVGGKPYDLTHPSTSTNTGGIVHQYEASVGFALTF